MPGGLFLEEAGGKIARLDGSPYRAGIPGKDWVLGLGPTSRSLHSPVRAVITYREATRACNPTIDVHAGMTRYATATIPPMGATG